MTSKPLYKLDCSETLFNVNTGHCSGNKHVFFFFFTLKIFILFSTIRCFASKFLVAICQSFISTFIVPSCFYLPLQSDYAQKITSFASPTLSLHSLLFCASWKKRKEKILLFLEKKKIMPLPFHISSSLHPIIFFRKNWWILW